MSTSSCIARPTATGYTGIYVHFDGAPSGRLPLLLAAYQHRFARDVEAMSVHLIDQVAIAWDELGTDLLDGAPTSLFKALTGGERWPSREMDDVITSDGSPLEREVITEANSDSLSWGYVLHPVGIEVISLYAADRGPIVGWNTDPRTRFSDHPSLWHPGQPVPATRPPRTAPPLATPAPTSTAARPATHR
ncbi:hypothetical protein GCM10010211_19930 [Streptomyces albospinus]|uniref:Uncharacterized protein n=1 Tax=Streptomyces albospinus TaxID=285515 RepID=A0ABQ2UV44_9ACTN|nr:hypothetical protein [Streptomyces albospinus]GGU55257.1 hypothetical protein GCM10010211_19930 [Streptomyces albospinus]